MDRSHEPRTLLQRTTVRLRAPVIALAAVLAVPIVAGTQALDICGCASIPNLPAFDSTNAATHPPGTVVNGTTLSIPVPADGILRFSSMLVRNHLVFQRNAANTPVTILVAGDVNFDSVTGCCWSVSLRGQVGTSGSASVAGVGGLGGPGGFRGGDGANQTISGYAIGGTGFGPGGGAGGAPQPTGACDGQAGTFYGAPTLLPLLGGGGGGGGCSSSAAGSHCSAGGGGGGGGGLLIAANGTIRIHNFQLFADGGDAGRYGSSGCSASGGGGAGGAIRLVASKLLGVGVAELYARGGDGYFSPTGAPGRIRLESLDASAQTIFTTTPPAQRIVGPTPLANPVAPAVTITSVGGAAVPAIPQGSFGSIDILLPAPGITTIDVATSGIPGGTTVLVTVKPRLGAAPVSETVPLSSCDAAGSCQATATFNLAAGSYLVEARATFQTQ